jgi:hypothetical protein
MTTIYVKKIFRAGVIILSMLIGLATIAVMGGCGNDDDSEPVPPGEFFVLTGGSGTLTWFDGAAQKNGELVIAEADAAVLTYPDRPLQGASVITIPGFIDQWIQRRLDAAPPAAALTVNQADQSPKIGTLVLSNPRYNATARELRFTVGGGGSVALLPGQFLTPDLFIDAPIPPSDSALFVVGAHAGTLKLQNKEAREFTLELSEVYPLTFMFYSGSNPKGTAIETSELALQWENYGFDAIPPNASVVVRRSNGEAEEAVFVLDSPFYDAKAKRLQFKAIQLLATETFPEIFADVDVFIDGADAPRPCTADDHVADNPMASCLRNCSEGQQCCPKGSGKNVDCWSADDPKQCTFTSCNGINGACNGVCVANRSTGDHQITLVNNTGQTIWIGAVASATSPVLKVGDWNWELANKATKTITAPYGWDSGRFWARTECKQTNPTDKNSLVCATGDCKGQRTCLVGGEPPAALAEFTLDGGANKGFPDNYDVSFVDGWNTLITIEPSLTSCKTVGICTQTPTCWEPGRWPKEGIQQGCLSPGHVKKDTKHNCACSMTEQISCPDQACSGGFGCSPFYPAGSSSAITANDKLCIPWGTVTRSDGTTLTRLDSKWDDDALQYIKNVSNACPDVYAWQFHDASSLQTSIDNIPVNYTVTFLKAY